MFRVAHEHGVPVDEAAPHAAATGLRHAPELTSIDHAVQDNTIIDPAMGEGWTPIANWKRPDGRWLTIDIRPPSRTAGSRPRRWRCARCCCTCRISEKRGRLAPPRAGQWLLTATPRTTEDHTFRLLGLGWAGASAAERSQAAQGLLALERANGGWAQHPESIALLRAYGANPNRMTLSGLAPNSPLFAATTYGDVDTIKTLIAAGSDVREKNADEMTALHWGVLGGQGAAAQALIQAGAPVNPTDEYGFTPLMYAATVDLGSGEMAAALLKAEEAYPNIQSKDGKTALAQAKRLQYGYIAAALEKSGARE